jgi:hypothetical protein
MGLDQGYIGISENPLYRFGQHKRSKLDYPINRAIKKYGDLLKFTIIAVFENEHDAKWQEYTLRHKRGMGWNAAVGGGIPPKSTRKGPEAWNYGKVTPDSVKKKISDSLKGRVRSKEHCRKISENKSGENHHMARKANVYLKDGTLIAENVVLSVWSKANGYSRTGLHPTTKNERRTYKGMYARYIE